MNFLNHYILFLILFTSCSQQKKDINTDVSIIEIEIPNDEKNINDKSFKLENGVLLYDGIPFSGIVNQFYTSNKIKSQSQYFHGKRQGYYNGFYENGNKQFERFYTDGLKSSIHKGWYLDGVQMFEYKFNNKGVYNGEVKGWFANGTLQKHFNFIEGKESGSQKMWDLNGKIRANFYTIEGERHGLIGLKKCVSVQTKKNEKN